MTAAPASGAALPIRWGGPAITVRRYGRRHWAVYAGRSLLCVTVYRKGAQAVQTALESAAAQVASAQAH